MSAWVPAAVRFLWQPRLPDPSYASPALDRSVRGQERRSPHVDSGSHPHRDLL